MRERERERKSRKKERLSKRHKATFIKYNSFLKLWFLMTIKKGGC
jgi:hypothetical protein